MALEKKAINLLQQRHAPPTIWERAYDWVTNSARIVVIITEALVLIAFGWRFYLDRTLNDLKEEIDSKGIVLKSLSTQEDEIRLLQLKVDTYKQIWNQASAFAPVIDEINGYLPSNAEEISISISETELGLVLSITGEAPRADIDAFENSFKDSDTFVNKSVPEFDRTEQAGDMYSFSMKGLILFRDKRFPLGKNEITEPEAQ